MSEPAVEPPPQNRRETGDKRQDGRFAAGNTAGEATTFTKGQSGNPSGRPKGIARLTRELFDGALDETIVQFWAGVMAGGALPDGRKPTVKESIEASKLLAAYGWGKPAEFVPIEDGDPLGLADSQAETMADALFQRADELAARRRKREAEDKAREDAAASE